MKKLNLILLLVAITASCSKPMCKNYCDCYAKGYTEGFCYMNIDSPKCGTATRICPKHKPGDSPDDGYIKGFIQGAEDE